MVSFKLGGRSNESHLLYLRELNAHPEGHSGSPAMAQPVSPAWSVSISLVYPVSGFSSSPSSFIDCPPIISVYWTIFPTLDGFRVWRAGREGGTLFSEEDYYGTCQAGSIFLSKVTHSLCQGKQIWTFSSTRALCAQ